MVFVSFGGKQKKTKNAAVLSDSVIIQVNNYSAGHKISPYGARTFYWLGIFNFAILRDSKTALVLYGVISCKFV